MQKKDLHMASALEELEPHFKVEANIARRPINQLLLSLKKMIEAAEKYRLEGDEESSYVLYMKYMNILSKIQKLPDFDQKKSLVVNMLGSNAVITKHFDHLEALQNSLKERYGAKQLTKPLAESTRLSEVNVDAASAPAAEVREVISCETLNKMVEDGTKLLIFDCRSEEHYELSKMTYKYNLNVPERILNLGMTASKIQDQLPNGSKVFWELRKTRPCIIFMDWASERFNRNSAVWHLKQILTEWDQEMEKQPEMLLLEGGYERWKTMYPMKCQNPQFSPPQVTNGHADELGDIEYPNLEDIQMKDTSLNKSQVPQIDRTMKPNAVKSYETSKTSMQLLEENEIIMNKSLQTEKELLNLETGFKEIVTDKENHEDSSTKEQAYLFKIWELQAKQNDYKIEENSIKEQLEQSKELIKEPQEMTKRMEVEQQLMMMERERKRIHEEREQKRKEREEALKHARYLKPNFNEHRTSLNAQRKDELILSPKALTNNAPQSIPSFDRCAKPTANITRQIFNEQDFSPVYGQVERGLTGLKNLGNTCYMNSIIQCLSNTSTLTQYLMENNFEKHVNRSNKTKGHIVRTLAAVIKMLWSGECKYISSKHLKAAIGEQDNLFYGMDQQDSHEFLIMLIDWLQSDLQTISVQNAFETLPASEKAWLEYTKARESFILRLFYGQIKSTVKCTVCGHESSTYETFSNLSLELPPPNIDRCHIDNCFNLYFHGEIVNGWSCPNCKMPREAIKKLDISKLPPVLVIHLKRFCADPFMNSTFRKKQVYVDFPLVDMDMMPYVARTEKNSASNSKHIYNLYAVSNHYGSMESGHYTAYCRNYKQKKWYKFDDHTVSSLDRADVKSSAAYILFYTSLPESNFIGSR